MNKRGREQQRLKEGGRTKETDGERNGKKRGRYGRWEREKKQSDIMI